MPHYPIAGKVVLVTGAASGIGRATARTLHTRGAHVVLADLRQEAVDAVRSELGRERSLAVAVDVTDRTALDGVVAAAVDRFGGLDVAVANAGIAADPPATVLTIDEAVFERVVEVDLLGVWRTVRAALPQVVARRGHVLITSSIYAFANGMVNAPYAVSKAAVEQLGRALRRSSPGTAPRPACSIRVGWLRLPACRPKRTSPVRSPAHAATVR